MTSQQFQSYVRIVLYSLLGALASYGITVSDSITTIVVAVAGILANLAWTVWGNRLAAILEDAKNRAGVEELAVKVSPAKVDPSALAASTSPEVKVKTS